jgi:hypothetical protein
LATQKPKEASLVVVYAVAKDEVGGNVDTAEVKPPVRPVNPTAPSALSLSEVVLAWACVKPTREAETA